MKKLMIAAVAAACGSAFALESANIVGYSQNDFRKKYTLVVPEFDKVGATGIDLQSITPVGIDMEDYGEGDINIQTFTDSANKSEQFFWFDAEVSESGESGWHDSAGEELAEKTFTKGEGFMLYMPTADGKLNISGEVNLDEVTIPCRKKYTLMGNIRPTTVSIQNIVPTGIDMEDYGEGDINIQTFTDSANKSEQFFWFDAEVSESGESGWHDSAGEELATKEFAAGEGFMIYMPAAGGSLKYKAVTL